jgi:YgiT-type zinc finger domain-containing protein
MLTKCPICGKSNLVRQRRHAEQYGFDLGVYFAEVCPSCGEVFWDESSIVKMERRAKRMGIWGLEQRTKVAAVGNSLAVRIPKRLAEFLGLRRGTEVSVHPIGRDKLVVEEAGEES